MQVGSITQLTENKNPISVQLTGRPKHKFVRLSPECGDWEAWYMDGKLIVEGHRARIDDFLDAIIDVFPNTHKSIEIPDEKAEEGFEVNLEDMI